MLAVFLAILVNLVVILKLGLRSISKRITGVIILKIFTPPQHTLSHIISFVLLQLIKTISFTSHTFPIASAPLALFCLCLFFFGGFLQSIVFIIPTLIIRVFYCLNHTLLLLHLFITGLLIDFVITM